MRFSAMRARTTCAALITAALLVQGCGPATQPVESPEAVAASRGIAWLLEHEPEMTADWAITTFDILSRIADDEAIADSMRAIVAARSATPIAPLPADLSDPALLRPMRLRPFVLELERRKRVGEPYRAVAGELEASLAADEQRLWTGTQPTQQLVLLSQFEGLGIATQRSLSAVSEDLAASWRVVEDRERLLTDTVFMFGITHVPYAASAYYRRPIRPSDYPFEREVLHHATQRYVSGPIPDNRFFLDLQAEVLVARGLLQIPEDEASRALRERLFASQHEDGSWGTPQSHHFIHATAVMIGALHAAPARLPR